MTEGLGGYNPHCDTHAENRNLQQALLQGHSMHPAVEAVTALGQFIGSYDFLSLANESASMRALSSGVGGVEETKVNKNPKP